MFSCHIFPYPAPKPENISCSASKASIDITWETPDADCTITGFEVTWDFNILWSNSDSVPETEEIDEVNNFTIENCIPYTEYFIEVTTLVLNQSGKEPARCSVITPEDSKQIFIFF